MLGRLVAISAAAFALIVGRPADAQMMGVAGGGLTASSSSYVGPGDVVAHTAFYSCARPYSNAYAVSLGNLCKLRATTGGETCNEPTTSAGAPDVMAGCSGASNGLTLAVFCATGCTVAEAYDQSGNGWHILQGTVGNQPGLTLNCLNSLPCIVTTTSSSIGLLAGSNITPATGLVTLDGVFDRSVGTATTTYVRENGSSGNRLIGQSGVANKVQAVGSAGTLAATANDATWHSILGIIASGASASAVDVDGTTTTGTITTPATAAGSAAITGGATTAEEMEAGFVDNVALNSTQLTNVCRNEQAAYGGGSNFGATC